MPAADASASATEGCCCVRCWRGPVLLVEQTNLAARQLPKARSEALAILCVASDEHQFVAFIRVFCVLGNTLKQLLCDVHFALPARGE